MQSMSRQAFTMVELVFVIVVIGILSAIALPRFGDSAESAYLTKAESEIAAIRSALATERQRRILRGDFTHIIDLGLKSDGTTASTGNAFDHFSPDKDGNTTAVFQYPVKACSNGGRGCWVRTNALNYSFRFLESSDGDDGQADFILNNSKFDCNSDDNDCQKIVH